MLDNIYVAFLRGINVGGKNKVSMAELKTCLERLSYGNVQPYGNSGNIIFTTASADFFQLETDLETALAANFFSSIAVFVRNLDQMAELVNATPKHWQASSEVKYDIIFLKQTIDNPKILADLQPKPNIDELYYKHGVLLWSIKMRDFSKSKLSKLVGTELYQGMTIRGLGTVNKVYELMSKRNKA